MLRHCAARLLLVVACLAGWATAMSVRGSAGAGAEPRMGIPNALGVSLTTQDSGRMVTLSNAFITVTVCRMRGRVVDLRGSFAGAGTFADAPTLVTAEGSLTLGVQSQLAPNAQMRSSGTAALPSLARLDVLANTTALAAFRLTGLRDAQDSSAVAALNLTFSLAAGSRALALNTSLAVLRTTNVTSLRTGLFFTPAAAYWRFRDGGLQMANHMNHPYFASHGVYDRWYALGHEGRGGVDLRVLSANASATDRASAAAHDAPPLPAQSVLYSGHWDGVRSGLSLLHAGVLPEEQWMAGWQGLIDEPPALVRRGDAHRAAFRIAPCDVAVPALDVPVDAVAGPFAAAVAAAVANSPRRLPVSQAEAVARAAEQATPSAMDANDAAALRMAVYASPVGAIQSHAFAPEGRISPCVFTPSTCYGGTYNYFDPDSFLSIAAMNHVADSELFEEARKLLDTNRGLICNATDATCMRGQLPHHLVDQCSSDDSSCVCMPNRVVKSSRVDCVTFAALSGATQTGPNIFWILASLRYVAYAGDVAWLRSAMPDLRSGLELLLSLQDPRVGLLNAPGSLFIDTFRRGNYTSDSNAAMVLLLDQFADAEDVVGNHTGAGKLRDTRDTIRTAMNALLWTDGAGQGAPPAAAGHFITQRDPDNATRDFVDYDANLLAAGAGVLDGHPDRAAALLARVDSGPCTHAHATYVSEVYYAPSDCVGGNYGDSAVTMGRIAVADGWARRRVGGAANAAVARDAVLAPLQRDLMANTWMYERYTCGAEPTHNPNYIEMPESVAMLLAEVKYGIELRLNRVIVQPFFPDVLATGYAYRVGQMDVRWAPTAFRAELGQYGTAQAGANTTRAFEVHGLTAGSYVASVYGAAHPVPHTPLKLQVESGQPLQLEASVGRGVVLSIALASV